eukprot:m.33538 g.33538  ORF g.33538 m.33538 type:complete len:176 (+) comp9636_c0_seq2:94-621(+)
MAAPQFSVREATVDDAEAIVDLIHLLAVYEKEEQQMKLTLEQFIKDGFHEPRRFHCLVGVCDGVVVGYALYFFIYSTWEGVSLYLEDLFVKKENRGQGLGLMLIRSVAQVASDNDCARFQWQCIDWNTSAMEFYTKRLGARERVETNDAKWLNIIMNRQEVAAFLADEPAATETV